MWKTSDGSHMTTIFEDHVIKSLATVGNHVIAADESGKILFVWDFDSDELSTVDIDGDPVLHVCSSTGRSVVLLCRSNIQLMDVQDFKVIVMIPLTLEGEVVSAAIDSTDSHVVIMTQKRQESERPVNKTLLVSVDKSGVKPIVDAVFCFTAGFMGSLLLGSRGKVLLLKSNSEDFTPICEMKTKDASDKAVTCVSTSADHSMLMTGNSRGNVIVWSVVLTAGGDYSNCQLKRKADVHSAPVCITYIFSFSQTSFHKVS